MRGEIMLSEVMRSKVESSEGLRSVLVISLRQCSGPIIATAGPNVAYGFDCKGLLIRDLTMKAVTVARRDAGTPTIRGTSAIPRH